MQMSPLLSGRLCFRELQSGVAAVGVVTLAPDFPANETDCFLLVRPPAGPWALMDLEGSQRHPLEPMKQSWGLGNLFTSQVWPTPTQAQALPVRLVQAFPDTNTWTVAAVSPFGFSEIQAAAELPSSPAGDHHWFDVRNGVAEVLDAPFDARGMAMGQLLNQQPVWPNAEGQFHTVPTLASDWCQHFYRYHQRLIEGARNGESQDQLRTFFSQDPHLQWCYSSVQDPVFVSYLEALDSMGALEVERPRTVAENQARYALVDKAMSKVFDLEDEAEPPPTGRSARPGF